MSPREEIDIMFEGGDPRHYSTPEGYSEDHLLQKCWKEGYDSAENLTHDDNPYDHRTLCWHAWASGWIDGTVDFGESTQYGNA
jgi:hypothetical protein